MKKSSVILAALAMVLVLGAGAGSAWAYFTTYVEAEGGYVVNLGDTTRIQEDVTYLHKAVTITSETTSQPVWIRVKAYYAEGELTIESNTGKWSKGENDDWWYYADIVKAGETTDVLDITISVPKESSNEKIPVEDFDVVVIYESTPVEYDDAGKPVPNDPKLVDWDKKMDKDKDITDPYDGESQPSEPDTDSENTGTEGETGENQGDIQNPDGNAQEGGDGV